MRSHTFPFRKLYGFSQGSNESRTWYSAPLAATTLAQVSTLFAALSCAFLHSPTAFAILLLRRHSLVAESQRFAHSTTYAFQQLMALLCKNVGPATNGLSSCSPSWDVRSNGSSVTASRRVPTLAVHDPSLV